MDLKNVSTKELKQLLSHTKGDDYRQVMIEYMRRKYKQDLE